MPLSVEDYQQAFKLLSAGLPVLEKHSRISIIGILEQCELGELNQDKLAKGLDKSIDYRAQLQTVKDCFTSLKFNYLELETKKLFLERIASGVELFQTYDTSEAEQDYKEAKARYKVEKEANAALKSEIKAQLQENFEWQDKLESAKGAIRSEMAQLQAQQPVIGKNKVSVETQTTPKKVQNAPTNKERLEIERLEKELAGLRAQVDFIKELSGVSIINKLETRVVVRLDDLKDMNLDAILTLDFDPARGVLTSASFSPEQIQHKDLLEYGLKINNAAFIVHELQYRLQTYKECYNQQILSATFVK